MITVAFINTRTNWVSGSTQRVIRNRVYQLNCVCDLNYFNDEQNQNEWRFLRYLSN